MGYTHYWRQLRDHKVDEWTQICEDVQNILKDTQHVQGIPIAYEYNEPARAPEVSSKCIHFNGLGEDGHETFIIFRKRLPRESWEPYRGSGFCKTARKPYDLAVTAILCYLSSVCETYEVSSDGDGTDWLAGLQCARRALPKYANILDIPLGILKNDRWCSPYPYCFSKQYKFRFCVDGRAYIFASKDESHAYVFPNHVEAIAWMEKHNDVINPTGWFDEKRTKMLEREQTRLLKRMVEGAALAGRLGSPPEFVRPSEMPKVEKDMPTFNDMLRCA